MSKCESRVIKFVLFIILICISASFRYPCRLHVCSWYHRQHSSQSSIKNKKKQDNKYCIGSLWNIWFYVKYWSSSPSFMPEFPCKRYLFSPIFTGIPHWLSNCSWSAVKLWPFWILYRSITLIVDCSSCPR